MTDASRQITDVTRRTLVDQINLDNIAWWGRLPESDFLKRIYPLHEMRSTDPRYSDAEGDIHCHRERFVDWESDWVFYDGRFELMDGPDEVLLRFLVETVHPAVRPDADEAADLVDMFNSHLAPDGWELTPTTSISGRPVYAARRLDEFGPVAGPELDEVADGIGSGYVAQQITRMRDASQSDPELAIGTAKEFLETLAKTILSNAGIEYGDMDFSPLVRKALKEIDIDTSGWDKPELAETGLRQILGNLGGLVTGVGELRNAIGTGHGKIASAEHPDAIYAALAVRVAVALGVFMYEAKLRE